MNALVNNAGHQQPPQSILKTSVDDYRDVIDVNQIGAYTGIHVVAPAIIEAGGGSIVNISSVNGFVGAWGIAGYVVVEVRPPRPHPGRRRIELARKGIRVNSIHPGPIDTPMLRGGLPGGPRPGRGRWPARCPPAGSGRVDDVAAMVAFLLSDESSYCYGAEFVVDGGFLAGPLGSPTSPMKLSLLFPETRDLDGSSATSRCRREEQGFHGMWLGSAFGFDPVMALALAGARDRPRSSSVSRCVPTWPRHPIVAGAAGRDRERGVRRPVPARRRPQPRAGDGACTASTFDRPISHLREYLDDRARAARHGQVSHQGERYQVTGFLDVGRRARRRRCCSGCCASRWRALAGGHADGALCWLGPATYLHEVVAPEPRRRARPPPGATPRRSSPSCPAPSAPTATRCTPWPPPSSAIYPQMPFYRAMFEAAGRRASTRGDGPTRCSTPPWSTATRTSIGRQDPRALRRRAPTRSCCRRSASATTRPASQADCIRVLSDIAKG